MNMADLLHKTRCGVAAAALGTACLVLGACAAAPPPRPVRAGPPPPVVDTNVYAYPLHGQTAEQLDRDRYECYVWANKQTGFDPSAANVPAQARVRVVSGPPPGTGVAAGAVTGAVLGAAVSNPWDRGAGAIVGAVIGSAIGATAEASQTQRVQEVSVRDRAQLAQIQQQASNYRRALSACLEGRGYSVR